MRRNRSSIVHTVQWTLGRGAPVAVVCYIIIFAVACSNLIAVCVFGVTIILDCQHNLERLPNQNHLSPSTSSELNKMITNATKPGSETTIILDDLIKILQVFRGNDIHLRHGYINAVLTYNNESVGLQELSENYRVAFSKNVTSQLYKDNTRTTETSNHSALLHRDKRLSELPHSFLVQTNTSFVNTSRQFHAAYNTPSSSLPLSRQVHSSLSGQAKKPDISKTIVSSKPFPESPGNGTEGKHLRPRSEIVYPQVLTQLVSCVNYTHSLTGRFKPTIQKKTQRELISMFPQLQMGGRFTPIKCRPKENTAIIIPYRNRYSHLNILLLNIVPLLIKQNVKFTIFVIEQELPGIFNRGMLFNVGFLEALKLDNFDCFIFHDVDIIPINDRNLYNCNHEPTHFLTGVNKFQYKLMYQNMFGGVVAFTLQQFTNINGASNLYFGWGGEDDDLQERVKQKGYTVMRKDSNVGLYDMIKHTRDTTNNANPLRKRLLKFASQRQDTEGLSTTVYTRHSVTQLPLYTWIKVSINMTRVLQTAPRNMQHIGDQMLKHFLSAETNSTKV